MDNTKLNNNGCLDGMLISRRGGRAGRDPNAGPTLVPMHHNGKNGRERGQEITMAIMALLHGTEFVICATPDETTQMAMKDGKDSALVAIVASFGCSFMPLIPLSLCRRRGSEDRNR